MPKCELKPWKAGEAQTVWVSGDGKRRINLTLRDGDRVWSFQVLCNGLWEYKELCTAQWAEMVCDLLGIPGNIEVPNGKE